MLKSAFYTISPFVQCFFGLERTLYMDFTDLLGMDLGFVNKNKRKEKIWFLFYLIVFRVDYFFFAWTLIFRSWSTTWWHLWTRSLWTSLLTARLLSLLFRRFSRCLLVNFGSNFLQNLL